MVDTAPKDVAAMLDAPSGETSAALVDRLAGVMAVNSLSADMLLARFFSSAYMRSIS